MSLITAIAVIIGAVVILSMLGIGASFFEGIQASIQEQQDQQNDSADPDNARVANLAKDTGTRVCDLKLEFVGAITDDLTSDDRKIFMGDGVSIFDTIKRDNSVIRYQWSNCGELSLASFFATLSFNAEKLALNSIFSNTSDGEVVRFKFCGNSIANGKSLYSPNAPSPVCPFQDQITLSVGAKFPIAFRVPVFLEDVTEDSYYIEYWNDNFQVNDQPVGKRFQYNLCKPGLDSC